MNKKVTAILLIASIICVFFAIFALVTFGFGVIWVIAQEDWNSVLSLIYSFFHLLITIVGAYLAVSAYKKNKSIVMRTLMYANDYKEIDPSKLAKAVCIILFILGGFAGIYFGLSYIVPGHAPGWGWPMMFRLVMVNVGLYLFLLSILFFIFPYAYDVDKDVEERKRLKNLKHQQEKEESIENDETNTTKDENL
ncbi:MAG: hypothetical protein IJQ67_03010 [Bacilli bacterium]|nr:hypothetical protein [Bacilli bacterium]